MPRGVYPIRCLDGKMKHITLLIIFAISAACSSSKDMSPKNTTVFKLGSRYETFFDQIKAVGGREYPHTVERRFDVFKHHSWYLPKQKLFLSTTFSAITDKDAEHRGWPKPSTKYNLELSSLSFCMLENGLPERRKLKSFMARLEYEGLTELSISRKDGEYSLKKIEKTEQNDSADTAR